MLLLLLPLQAFAAVTACAHAKAPQAAAMEGMENCQMAQDNAGTDGASKSGGESPQSCCATMACAICSALASAPRLPASVAAHEQSGPLIFPQYTSFIPDGLQRPPTIRA